MKIRILVFFILFIFNKAYSQDKEIERLSTDLSDIFYKNVKAVKNRSKIKIELGKSENNENTELGSLISKEIKRQLIANKEYKNKEFVFLGLDNYSEYIDENYNNTQLPINEQSNTYWNKIANAETPDYILSYNYDLENDKLILKNIKISTNPDSKKSEVITLSEVSVKISIKNFSELHNKKIP